MPLEGIDHFTVNVRDLDASVRFYEDVLGLKSGPRPDLGFPGAWIYCGDRPIIHLVGGRAPPEGAATGGGGVFDHIALSARGREAVCRQLAEHGVPFESRLGRGGRWQVFLRDIDGIKIELNFAGD